MLNPLYPADFVLRVMAGWKTDDIPPWRRGAGAQWGVWSIDLFCRYPIGGRIQQEEGSIPTSDEL